MALIILRFNSFDHEKMSLHGRIALMFRYRKTKLGEIPVRSSYYKAQVVHHQARER